MPDGDFISLEEKQTVQQIPLEFSIDEVRKLLQNLKTGKSPGPSGFHPRFINELVDELCLPLYLIFRSIICKLCKNSQTMEICKGFRNL